MQRDRIKSDIQKNGCKRLPDLLDYGLDTRSSKKNYWFLCGPSLIEKDDKAASDIPA